MPKRLFKWGCFEAYPADDGVGVKHLVTDRDGRFLGVRKRVLAPDEPSKDIDQVARHEPRKQVKRMTNEQVRAVTRGMVKQHGKFVLAPDVVTARKMLGLDQDEPAPTPSAKAPKKKTPKTEPAPVVAPAEQ